MVLFFAKITSCNNMHKFSPYVHKLDKRVRTHGRLNAQTEYKVRTHWAFKRPKSVKMSFIHFTGVLYGQFFYAQCVRT